MSTKPCKPLKNYHKPWLVKNISEFYYWNKYKNYLFEETNFPPSSIAMLDDETDRILDLLETPDNKNSWDRRGMVLGHVQSGKTANYTGLICKAADVGYKIIIVAAGLSNDLRNQTQKRIDEGFGGVQIKGNMHDNTKIPTSLTSYDRDFDRATAGIVSRNLHGMIHGESKPIYMVVKKNTYNLDNIIKRLEENKVHDIPMLFIDDEADNASINTNAEDEDSTEINKKIRRILAIFKRKCYVAYTATPFANIFIDPASDDEMLGNDLFPRDFIVTLYAPSNYFGASKIFLPQESDDGIIKIISDNEESLPVKHNKSFRVKDIPNSLREAILTFIFVCAIRCVQQQYGKHSNTMMINISPYKNIHNIFKELVDEFLYEVRKDIFSSEESMMKKFKKIYDDFNVVDCTWEEIKKSVENLMSSKIKMNVKVLNSSSKEKIDYSQTQNLIVVGGYTLSRGLTLEGLSVSYFLRNSRMYDTLLQMSRWFGYREGYENFCRIWMTAEMEDSFVCIARSAEELLDDIKMMEKIEATPQNFGLKVRRDPCNILIMTSRNKMRSAHTAIRTMSFSNRLVETFALHKNKQSMQANLNALLSLLEILNFSNCDVEKETPHYFWDNVQSSKVIDFLRKYKNHPRSRLTHPELIKSYVESKNSCDELNNWDVGLIQIKSGSSIKGIDRLKVFLHGFEVQCPQRTPAVQRNEEMIYLKNRRLISGGDEKIGLDKKKIKDAESLYLKQLNKKDGFNVPDKAYRRFRKRPLLLIYLLDLIEREEGKNPRHISSDGVVAWAISFPKSDHEDVVAEYFINKICKKEFDELDDEHETDQ